MLCLLVSAEPAVFATEGEIMDFLKSQYAKMRVRLGALSPGQRMLAASLAVLLVMALILWGRYSGQAEMESVLDQDMGPDEIVRITGLLDARSIPFKTSGSRVLVPADRKMEVLAVITYEHMIPNNTQTGIDKLISDMSPWESPDTQAELRRRYREMTLADILRRWPRVRDANIMIDPQRERGFGSGDIRPTASINLTLKTGEKGDEKLAAAAADFVAGAVAGLSRSQIAVVIDGAGYRLSDGALDSNANGAQDLLDQIRQSESWYATKIRAHFCYIDKIVVSVTVDPNGNSPRQEGADVEAGVARHANPPSVVLATPTAATVRVPRSWFVQTYRQNNHAQKDPEDIALRPFIDDQLSGIRDQVKACTGIKNNEAIVVGDYTDLLPVSPSLPQTAAGGVWFIVDNHAREIALGSLAAISLVLILLVARRTPMPFQVYAGHRAAGRLPQRSRLPDDIDLNDQTVLTPPVSQRQASPARKTSTAAAIPDQAAPFAFLQDVSSHDVLTFIRDEHPQTIALILAHLSFQRAGEILAGLPASRQVEVVKRVAAMEQTDPQAILEVARALAQRMAHFIGQNNAKPGGVNAAAGINNVAGHVAEPGIVDGPAIQAPALVEQLRRGLFAFEDIVLVNDMAMQTVLKELDHDVLAMALKTAGQTLQDKIFRNMSHRAAQLIQEEMQCLGSVRISAVEQAQQQVADVIRRLEDAGRIGIIVRRGRKEVA